MEKLPEYFTKMVGLARVWAYYICIATAMLHPQNAQNKAVAYHATSFSKLGTCHNMFDTCRYFSLELMYDNCCWHNWTTIWRIEAGWRELEINSVWNQQCLTCGPGFNASAAMLDRSFVLAASAILPNYPSPCLSMGGLQLTGLLPYSFMHSFIIIVLIFFCFKLIWAIKVFWFWFYLALPVQKWC